MNNFPVVIWMLCWPIVFKYVMNATSLLGVALGSFIWVLVTIMLYDASYNKTKKQ